MLLNIVGAVVVIALVGYLVYTTMRKSKAKGTPPVTPTPTTQMPESSKPSTTPDQSAPAPTPASDSPSLPTNGSSTPQPQSSDQQPTGTIQSPPTPSN